jgi:hypothetical protein
MTAAAMEARWRSGPGLFPLWFYRELVPASPGMTPLSPLQLEDCRIRSSDRNRPA